MRKLTLCLTILLTSQAQAAGFDCSKASTKVEKLICAEAKLSTLDDQMSEEYLQLLNGANPDIFQEEQRKWLKFQRDTCPDANCIGREYEEKLAVTNKEFWPDFEADEKRMPPASAFGNYEKDKTITVYNGEGDQKSTVTHMMQIYKVQAKTKMAIVDVDLTFDNGHSCSLNNMPVSWSENHWQMGDEMLEDSCQLRIYPAGDEFLLSDPEQSCKGYCGARGSFDGIVVEREGDIKS